MFYTTQCTGFVKVKGLNFLVELIYLGIRMIGGSRKARRMFVGRPDNFISRSSCTLPWPTTLSPLPLRLVRPFRRRSSRIVRFFILIIASVFRGINFIFRRSKKRRQIWNFIHKHFFRTNSVKIVATCATALGIKALQLLKSKGN